MKIARFFAVVLGCIGSVLLVGSMGFLLWNRNAPLRVLELPREAVACCDEFVQALNSGNLEAAAQLMYGQPDLGVSEIPEDSESALLWEAFRRSIAVELDETWNVEQGCFVRTGSITRVDVSTILGKLPERVQTLLDQKVKAAETLSDIYDERGEFREDLVAELLELAVQEALSQDVQTVTSELTLKLVNRDGHWWVVPHQNLLQVFTGLA